MQVKTLRCFAELAESGSFYRAAKNLRMSQQGLNKTITSMENELGVPLVERSSQGIRLTHEGEVVLSHARTMYSEYESMVDDLYGVRTQSDDRSDRVMVHVSYYSAQIASADQNYVRMLTENVLYIEEPFEKLVKLAESSDGSDLVFLDVHHHSMAQIMANPNVVFDPVLVTKLGFMWHGDSPLACEASLHRETVSKCPVAINTFREIAQFTDELFRETPLEDVRMGASSPRMLLEYARQSAGVACELDSFGFYLAQRYSDVPAGDVHFKPLSTPAALAQVGFLYPKGVRMSMNAAQVVKTLRSYLAERCADYLAQYPVIR